MFAPQASFLPGFVRPGWKKNSRTIASTFEVDAKVGYRPILGTHFYGDYGCAPNTYAFEKPAGHTRLLFIGDSVTRRAEIARALEHRLANPNFEFWNAGVEGYNLIQVVEHYMNANRALEPDHVILTFHNNDFHVTPVAFIDDEGKFTVVGGNARIQGLDPRLFRMSHLYRWYITLSTSRQPGSSFDLEVERVRSNMTVLRDELDEKRIEFSVVLFPILRPFRAWLDKEVRSRNAALAILGELDIRYYDVLEPVQAAIAKGVPVGAGGKWHPSQAGGRIVATHLLEEGFLGR
jgi:hypothetical protein